MTWMFVTSGKASIGRWIHATTPRTTSRSRRQNDHLRCKER